MRIDVLTLFPEMFAPVIGTSIPKRAAEKGLVEYHLTNIRDFALDANKSVDDKPFGGGPGMVMMCQTIFDAVAAIEAKDQRKATRILLTPQGKKLDQETVEQLARQDRLLLIAGHYLPAWSPHLRAGALAWFLGFGAIYVASLPGRVDRRPRPVVAQDDDRRGRHG